MSDAELPRRVVVIGISGCGKTTLARELSATCGVPHVELDELFWDDAWTPKPPARFRELARAAVAGPGWVVDGNYSLVRDIVWPGATHVVWLNYPRWLVVWRVFRRTLRRLLTGQALWHGNRESWRRAFCSSESILVWAWTMHAPRRREFLALRAGGAFPQLQWTELTRPAQARNFLHQARQRAAARGADAGPARVPADA